MNKLKHTNIAIFHIGALGDTLISIAAFRAIRDHFKGINLTLIHECEEYSKDFNAFSFLKEEGLVDSSIYYYKSSIKYSNIYRAYDLLKLFIEVRKKKFDALIYLIRNDIRKRSIRIRRDIIFFRLAGIKNIYAQKIVYILPKKKYGKPLPCVIHQTDQILARLRSSKIAVPPTTKEEISIKISQKDMEYIDSWLYNLPTDGNKRWIAIGPGSKMSSKRWPKERYGSVISELIKKHDIWPVIFGGLGDQKLGNELIKEWGRGYNTARYLDVRRGIAALKRCSLYLGNDTGTMHMAVIAGIRCIAIFSSRDIPGNWFPYGNNHTVIRKQIDCEGCMLEVCRKRKNECLLSISVDQVIIAVEKVLSEDSHLLSS